MELYGVGNMILYYREKNKLTQTQVGEGICTDATMSRIETGCREFDSLISEALLGRLGKTGEFFEFVLDDEDYLLRRMRQALLEKLRKAHTEGVDELLAEYEERMPAQIRLHRQFALYCRALQAEILGRGKEEALDLFHQAIDLTRPNYLEQRREMMLYSPVELNIVYKLFLYEKYEEDVLFPVIYFMEKMYDAETQNRVLIPFYVELMKRYEEEKNFTAMEKVCEKAVAVINRGRSYEHLADFSFGKLKARERKWRMMGCPEEMKQELLHGYEDLYYMSMLEENQERMREIEKFCRERMGCRIIEREI